MLKSGGLLIFEIGVGQEHFVRWILNRNDNFHAIEYHKDDAGTIRVVSAQKVGPRQLSGEQ